MMTIYVGNLNYRSTEEQIEEIFSRYGEVSSCKLIIDRQTGRSRGFGFVEMENEVAEQAIAALNGAEFDSRSLKVHEAREREEGGMNRGGGGGERRPFQQRNRY